MLWPKIQARASLTVRLQVEARFGDIDQSRRIGRFVERRSIRNSAFNILCPLLQFVTRLLQACPFEEVLASIVDTHPDDNEEERAKNG